MGVEAAPEVMSVATSQEEGVCECHRTGIPNRGFRWARAA